MFTQNDSSGFSFWVVLVIDPGLFLFWRLHPSRAAVGAVARVRLIPRGACRGSLPRLKKTVNGFVVDFKAVLLFQAPRYF